MSDKKTDIAITSVKSVLGMIPYFGTALNESIFEHRSRVKQKRINDFVQSLSDYIQELNLEAPSSNHISSDEFGDIFEAIIRKISETSNKEKATRFKLILANQILNPAIPDFIETYIDLIAKLNEIQIQILASHHNNKPHLNEVKIDLNNAENKLKKLKDIGKELRVKAEKGVITKGESITENMKDIAKAELAIIKTNERAKNIQKFRECSFYGINDGDFLFFKQDLVSKGLLRDVGVGSIGTAPYQAMDITEFGIGLLKFIQN